MKCVICNGQLQEKVTDYQEFGITFGKFKSMACSKCGETFFDSKTADAIQRKSKELGLFGLSSKKTKVAMVGNSLAIRIPKEIAKFTNLKKEEEVRIIPKNKREITLEVL
ncbi:MAG: AbrB/MazE/SpoVT family DNA-binding domain-containing protein [Nanoarchaeota archaeon]